MSEIRSKGRTLASQRTFQRRLTLHGRGQRLLRVATRFPYLPSDGRYNITLSQRSQFVWFRVAKVGTRSILRVLREHTDLDLDHASNLLYPSRAYSGYFKFAFVRNPWDRLVSAWQSKFVEGPYGSHAPRGVAEDFGRFVEYVESQDIERCDRHWRLQSSLIDLNSLTFLGRFESFEEDLTHVCSQIGIQVLEMPHRAASTRQTLSAYYTDELVERVGRVYARDVRLFGYSPP